ncbi:MAG: hypothetical protein U0525_01905 [Patescibacteria group bacterium]
MRSNQKSKIKNRKSSTLTILVLFLVVSLVALAMLLLFGGEKRKETVFGNGAGDSGGLNGAYEKVNKSDLPKQNSLSGLVNNQKTETITSENNEEINSSETSNKTQTSRLVSNQNTNQPPVLCTEEDQIYCVITSDNDFLNYLENNPFVDGVLIDGKKVEVKKIYHQLVYRTLSDNQVTDSEKQVLASSQIIYNETTQELNILIGVDQKYFDSIGYSEKKTMYTAQLVRAIFSITGEVASNYPKVAKIVGKLSYWDPNLIK